MKRADVPNTVFSRLDKDFKAEVIAAELIENGTAADRLLIMMLGAMKRTFSKDVEAIEEDISDYDHKEYTVIKTGKEGIYDMLPEGLFHLPTAHKTAKSEKEIIKLIKQRRAEERDARQFFLPFEATINFVRVQMALHENRLDKRSHYDDLVSIFRDQWEIFQWLDAAQSNIFLHLVPIMHELRDDLPKIEKVMEVIFLLPAKISLRTQLPVNPASPFFSKLGDSNLGVDLTTGNGVYDEGVEEIFLQIGPMQNDQLQSFLPGGINNKILQLLSDYFLPVHMDVVVDYLLKDEDKATRLSNAGNQLNSMLGADTWL